MNAVICTNKKCSIHKSLPSVEAFKISKHGKGNKDTSAFLRSLTCEK